VTADIDGFLHFFAVTPSPRKNDHLCKVSNFNTSQVGTLVNYPIRAMDFDSAHSILYTGDEMGYIQRWDLTSLFDKLSDVSKREAKSSYKKEPGLDERLDGVTTTFVTGVETKEAAKQRVEFAASDVNLVYRWNAHTDTINYVTYVPELDILTSCSFDCNVYIWKWKVDAEDKGYMKKIGSLVLGTQRLWEIKIDKSDRVAFERQEAQDMLKKVEKMSMDELFQAKRGAQAEKPLL